MSATTRLIVRAVIVGVSTVLVQLSNSSSWSTAVIEAAVVAGVLAAVEALTPVNPSVGLGKKVAA